MSHAESFVDVLATLERTFQVRHIAAFPLVSVPENYEIEKIRTDYFEKCDFSHVPVRSVDGRIHSVLHRDRQKHHDSVKGGKTIDAAAPLLSAVDELAEDDGFLLVRSPESGFVDGVSGIVNSYDLQKPPVRIMLFAMVSELEARLRFRVGEAELAPGRNLEGLVGKYRTMQGRGAPRTDLWLREPTFMRTVRNAVAHSNWIVDGDEIDSTDTPVRRIRGIKNAVKELRAALRTLRSDD